MKQTAIIPLVLLACIIPAFACTDLYAIADPLGRVVFSSGEHVICPGTYENLGILAMEKNVTITCLPGTVIRGPGETVFTFWTTAVSFPAGFDIQADFTMRGCTIENYMAAVAGYEVDEDEQHLLHKANGSVTLVNNTFRTRYALFWCAARQAVTLVENIGSPVVILLPGRIVRKSDSLPVLFSDPTGYDQGECTESPMPHPRPTYLPVAEE